MLQFSKRGSSHMETITSSILYERLIDWTFE